MVTEGPGGTLCLRSDGLNPVGELYPENDFRQLLVPDRGDASFSNSPKRLHTSNFTYVEATCASARRLDRCPTRARWHPSAACRVSFPDNAEVAAIKTCLYEPQINRTHAEMAAHYGTAMLPKRPRRPGPSAAAPGEASCRSSQ
jgi:hypothetical protein